MSSTSFITTRALPPTRLFATAIGAVLIAGPAAANPAAAAPNDAAAPDPDARDTQQLERVTVEGKFVREPASPKFTAPLLDTPRAVSVVPEKLITDMGATDLIDALRVVPGITFGAGEGGNPQGDRPFLRGFDAQSSIFVDGVRDVGAQSRETFAIEQVEVVKGPDSVFNGRSNGGGSINLISKLPQADDFTRIDVGIGNGSYRRATIDSNLQIGSNAALRVNLLGHDAGVAGRDAVHGRRFGLAPSFSFGLGGPTQATLSFYHLDTDEVPDSGVPYHFGMSNLPAGVRVVRPDDGGNRDAFYGLLDRDFRRSDTNIGTLILSHEFDGGLSLRNTTRYGRSQQDYILTQPDDSQGNVVHGEVWRRVNTRAGNTVSAINQTDLSGTFQLGGFDNRFSTGLELANEKSHRDSFVVPYLNAATACGQLGPGAASMWNCTLLGNANPHDPWQPGTWTNGSFVPAAITRANAPIRTRSATQAVYALDTVQLAEQWLLNLGARYDRFSTTAPVTWCPDLPGYVCPRGYQGTRITEDHRSTSGQWSWQAGVVWKPVEPASVYFSWATSATPPGSFLGEGSDTNPLGKIDLDAEHTRNLELGVKWNLLGERLAVSADIFQTEKTNARQQNAEGGFSNIGKTRVQGVELSANGQLTERWSVFAGYAYMHGKLLDGGFVNGAPNPLNGTPLANTPRHSLSLWTNWQLTPAISLAGGAFHVGEVAGSYRVNAADQQITQYGVPSYWRFDAMASWHINENLDLRLNLQNLTDETYYTKAYPVHFAAMAPGRTAILSASLKF